MRAVILRSLGVIAVGGLVLAGVLYVASTVDGRPPEVLGVALTQPLPDDPRQGVITTSLEVRFSEPVREDAAASLEIDPEVTGTVSWSGSTMIFTPSQPLELETSYTVSIGRGVRDLAGNEMTELPPPFTFETSGRPRVADTDPVDGATDVPVDASIDIRFSTLMDTASVDAALRLRPAVPHALRWSGELLQIIPSQPFRPGTDIEVEIGAEAADVAGVALGTRVTLGFRTVAPGLSVVTLVPADAVDGVAPRSPIAVIFDRAVDPDTVSGDLLSISPDVPGALDLVAAPDDSDGARVLRFTPSGPLPSNTTFEVELAPGITGPDGGGLAEPVTWTFTTGAPTATLSNQIIFISDRAGIANVWAMNPDGTAARQLSAELSPVVDYAVAPDGSSFVVGDGRRLVYSRADGSERRVLTDEGFLEFDPAYAPDARRIAFARAGAESGEGLGIWQRAIDAAAPERLEMPLPILGEPVADDAWLRAPRYSPDGQALAFVDTDGRVGVVELPADRLLVAEFAAEAPPAWLPDSSAILLTGRAGPPSQPQRVVDGRVDPLRPRTGAEVGRMFRSGTQVDSLADGGIVVAAVAANGRVAWLDDDGTLRVADAPDEMGSTPAGMAGVSVAWVAFAPDENVVVMVLAANGEDVPAIGRVELLNLDDGDRTELGQRGMRPRWLP
ncbi:MAG TPA: Ig-like domain-containing protein [Methylomirabilota bacterium]|nr:Ig-like domain-containing protein [Methylomirabilota bacterium]